MYHNTVSRPVTFAAGATLSNVFMQDGGISVIGLATDAAFTTATLTANSSFQEPDVSKGVEVTAANATDVFTGVDAFGRPKFHNLANGTLVNITSVHGAVPTGLSAATQYYVITSTPYTFQLSTSSGGAAATFTTDGTGTLYVSRTVVLVASLDDLGDPVINIAAVASKDYTLTRQMAGNWFQLVSSGAQTNATTVTLLVRAL